MMIVIKNINNQMIKKIIIFTILFLQFFLSFSQKKDNCGFSDISIDEAKKLPWYGNETFLHKFTDSLYKVRKADKDVENVIFRVPVKFWVYRRSDGTSGPGEDLPTDIDFQNMMDELNTAFRNNNVPIRFYMMNLVEFVDNDDEDEGANIFDDENEWEENKYDYCDVKQK